MHRCATALVVLACTASAAVATDLLVVTDRRAHGGTASVEGKLRAGVVPISKGATTDTATIAARLDVSAGGVQGAVVAPAGAFDGTAGWTDNTATQARYRSPSSSVRRTAIVTARSITLAGASLGDPLLDALAGGAASGPVYAAYSVNDAGEVIRHCVRFDAGSCSRRVMAHGLTSRVRCRNPVADPDCVAVAVPCNDTQDPPPSTCYPAFPPDCCQSQNACVDAPSFSLNRYLFFYCSSVAGGSTPVVGGVCNAATGTCDVQTIAPPTPVCCQLIGSCYDDTAASTAALWGFRNYCTGGQNGTTYGGAACGAAGECVPSP
jgi:hypothetical protein